MSHNVCIERPRSFGGLVFHGRPARKAARKAPRIQCCGVRRKSRGQCQNCPRGATLAGAVALASPPLARGGWRRPPIFVLHCPKGRNKEAERRQTQCFMTRT